MLRRSLVTSLSAALLLALSACAEHGQPASSQPAQAGQMGIPVGKPLMVIRFNQQYVYFKEPLEKAISAASQARPGAAYEVHSLVPASLGNNVADRNLRSVLRELKNLGVSPTQVGVNVHPNSPVASQEVRIYVR